MSNVACNGSEIALTKCDAAHIPPDEGREVYMHVNVAGVSCSEIPPTSGLDPTNPMTSTKTKKDNSYLIGLCITVVLLVMLIVMIIRYTILHHILQQIYSLYTYIII